jgi:hypothetical protein
MVRPLTDAKPFTHLPTGPATESTPGAVRWPTEATDDSAGLPTGWVDELLLRSVYVLCFPLILREKWRRRRERQTDATGARRHAVDDAVNTFLTRIGAGSSTAHRPEKATEARRPLGRRFFNF